MSTIDEPQVRPGQSDPGAVGALIDGVDLAAELPDAVIAELRAARWPTRLSLSATSP